MFKNPIARKRIPNPRYTVGTGYITLPYDVDRKIYIENCYRSNIVDILTDDGEYIQDVRIDKLVLQQIEFPFNIDDLGSIVVFVNEIVSNQPFIIATLARRDEYDNLEEKEFKFFKSFGEYVVTVRGQGKRGNLLIHLKSPEDENGFYIDIVNSETKGKFKITIQGDYDLFVEKDVNIEAVENINLTATKKIVAISEDDTELTAQKILIQNKDKYSVKELFDEIITEISNITVQTSMGAQPIINKIQVEDLKNKVAQIFK